MKRGSKATRDYRGRGKNYGSNVEGRRVYGKRTQSCVVYGWT